MSACRTAVTAWRYGPALENFPSDDATADTARVMQLFEQMIRRCPEQYLWMHARFKRQADGENLY